LLFAAVVPLISLGAWWKNRPDISSAPPARIGRIFAKITTEGQTRKYIPVGTPLLGTAVALPDGSEIYLTTQEAGVSVIRTSTHSVTHVPPVGQRQSSLVASRDSRWVYAGAMDGVYRIDTKTKTVKRFDLGSAVTDLALTPDARTLYVALGYRGLKKLLTDSGEIVQLPTTACPMHLAMHPSGRHLYVVYRCGGPGGRPGHDTIEVLELPAESVAGRVKDLPLVGGHAVFTPDGSHLWVDGADACYGPYDHEGCPIVPGRVMHVIRDADQSTVHSIAYKDVTRWYPALSFSPDGSRALLGNLKRDVLDTARFTVLESLQLGNGNDHFGATVF
jgi:hypothetical protein